MQTRREEILTFLKRKGEATVDELATLLDLTPVTVRHHLDILRAECLVEAPAVRRRRGPGRPQYVYTLTEAAASHFPQRYDNLANELLDEMKESMGGGAVKELLERIGERRLAAAPSVDPNLPMSEKLALLVAYLTEQGFIGEWECKDGKWFIYASNCPYHNVGSQHPEICAVDKFLIENLVGTTIISVQRITQGSHCCVYQISENDAP